MKIELKTITVRELTADYQDNAEGGVFGYGESLIYAPHISVSLSTGISNGTQ